MPPAKLTHLGPGTLAEPCAGAGGAAMGGPRRVSAARSWPLIVGGLAAGTAGTFCPGAEWARSVVESWVRRAAVSREWSMPRNRVSFGGWSRILPQAARFPCRIGLPGAIWRRLSRIFPAHSTPFQDRVRGGPGAMACRECPVVEGPGRLRSRQNCASRASMTGARVSRVVLRPTPQRRPAMAKGRADFGCPRSGRHRHVREPA